MIPDMKCREMGTESELLTASIGGVDYDGQDIVVGGDAGDGDESDSRRQSIWDDDEF